jgi:glycosyltransferase involved in cell wall biosynthesis
MDIVPAELSIITPVFNGERYLAEVIDSIVAQQDIEIEYIIVNDGSTDSSLAISNKYQQLYPKMIRVFDQKNSGEASAVNFGFLQAESEFVCIVNADDPLLPGHCRTMVDILRSSNAIAAYPDWLMIDDEGTTIRLIKTRDFSKRVLIAKFLCIPGPGSVFRRTAVMSSVPRDSSFRFISDYVMWVHLSLVGDFVRVPEVLATWRFHAGGATQVGGGSPVAKEFERYAYEYASQLLDGKVPSSWFRVLRSHVHYHMAIQAVADTSYNGRLQLLKSLRVKPWPSLPIRDPHRSISRMLVVLIGRNARIIVDVRSKFLARKSKGQISAVCKTTDSSR